ncbi:MAG: sugar phosphate isomerase/epimerase [Treponema sp.]|nr:sugar phosphate isomerase/epimerase [Treponema sp.]
MQERTVRQLPQNIGLGSFAFRYAIGIKEFRPSRPMDAFAFVEKAHRMGFRRIQLCENLNFHSYSKAELQKLRDVSRDLGMIVEVGLKKLDEDNIARHFDIALLLGSPFIRAVSHDHDNLSKREQEEVAAAVTKLLKEWAPRLKDNGLCLGLENHFDLATRHLVRIVKDVAAAEVGLVFDSTNSLGFLELPENTLREMLDFVLSVHLKDYAITKGEAGYEILGTVLGEGSLNIKAIFSLLGARLLQVPVILESAARRNFEDSPEQVLRWEEDVIKKNTCNMGNLLKEITI